MKEGVMRGITFSYLFWIGSITCVLRVFNDVVERVYWQYVGNFVLIILFYIKIHTVIYRKLQNNSNYFPVFFLYLYSRGISLHSNIRYLAPLEGSELKRV